MVAFADVNLSADPVRGNHNPGAGGWPTVKYFNKDTGYEGRAYEKKTDMQMCSELGPGEKYMDEFIQEKAGHVLGMTGCSPSDLSGCDERQKDFIAKWTAVPVEKAADELARLGRIGSGKMKPDLLKWKNARMALLKQITAPKGKAEL